ncbi:MAG: hypothetical protein B6U89_06685 [Desulfurococcales archaeon ex4484_58]|nr:MAG: hypothetical protein B6U89_06685 [Desulfurococcales archaeon ex4484_58]
MVFGVKELSKEKPVYVVRVRDKEITLDEGTLNIVREYLHRPMGLDELADKLGLDGWEEAYEFLKKIPAWIIWTPPSLWKYRIAWLEKKEA